jgi:hypothetical protein
MKKLDTNYDPNPRASQVGEVEYNITLGPLKIMKFIRRKPPTPRKQKKQKQEAVAHKDPFWYVPKEQKQDYEVWYAKKLEVETSPQLELPSETGRKFKCAASGYQVTCTGPKCKAHIVTQQLKGLKSDGMNVLTVCKVHEKHFNSKPLKEWYEFVKEYHPHNFQYVQKRIVFVLEQLQEFMEVAY